jgi:hypothetical protein
MPDSNSAIRCEIALGGAANPLKSLSGIRAGVSSTFRLFSAPGAVL